MITEEQLRAKHPRFLANCPLECGPGWFKLIDDLITDIVAYDDTITADQIKEKYGTLRCYTNATYDAVDELIEDAEALSAETCEECGEPGTLNQGGWWETRCRKHKAPGNK